MMTNDEIRALADARYSGAEYGYTGPADKLFALLLDVADVYVAELRDAMAAEYERAAGEGREPFLGLGTLAGMDAVKIAVTGLEENLEMRDEGRRAAGA